jgi:hypothetical protein
MNMSDATAGSSRGARSADSECGSSALTGSRNLSPPPLLTSRRRRSSNAGTVLARPPSRDIIMSKRGSAPYDGLAVVVGAGQVSWGR